MTKTDKAILITIVTLLGTISCCVCAAMLGVGLCVDDMVTVAIAVFGAVLDVVSTVMFVYAIYTEEG